MQKSCAKVLGGCNVWSTVQMICVLVRWCHCHHLENQKIMISEIQDVRWPPCLKLLSRHISATV